MRYFGPYTDAKAARETIEVVRRVYPVCRATCADLTVEMCHVTRYRRDMIKTFADERIQKIYATGKAKRFAPDLSKRARRRLEYVDYASRIDDLKEPGSNRLRALGGDRQGQLSISINDQWRICFRFEDGDAYDVEICDYH